MISYIKSLNDYDSLRKYIKTVSQVLSVTLTETGWQLKFYSACTLNKTDVLARQGTPDEKYDGQ